MYIWDDVARMAAQSAASDQRSGSQLLARLGRTEHVDGVTLLECLSAFPSLVRAPRELEALDRWFDGGGLTEQAVHAAAFVLELFGVPGIELEELEALTVWDSVHQAAYRDVKARIGSEGEPLARSLKD